MTVQSPLLVRKGIFGWCALRNFVRCPKSWVFALCECREWNPSPGHWIWYLHLSSVQLLPLKRKNVQNGELKKYRPETANLVMRSGPSQPLKNRYLGWKSPDGFHETQTDFDLCHKPKSHKRMQYGRAEEIKGLTSVLGLRRMLMHFLFFVVNILLLFFSY